MKRYLPFVIIVVVLAVAVVGFSMLWKKGGSTDPGSTFTNSNQTAPSVKDTSSQPSPSSDTSNQPSPGSAPITKPNVKTSSPVIVEEYGDYQCPPCGLLYPELKQIEKDYGNQIQIVFHHFPLVKLHKNAMVAAHAAEAARNQNRFWEMHDRLYRNQKDWAELDDPRPKFSSYARELNLNVDQFNSDMDSNLVDQRVLTDMQRGTALGVTGTPSIFIDHQMLRPEATNPEGLRRGINVMMERKAVS
jgi:protein-disulfide isomerase